jgi:hypothetical protein
MSIISFIGFIAHLRWRLPPTARPRALTRAGAPRSHQRASSSQPALRSGPEDPTLFWGGAYRLEPLSGLMRVARARGTYRTRYLVVWRFSAPDSFGTTALVHACMCVPPVFGLCIFACQNGRRVCF